MNHKRANIYVTETLPLLEMLSEDMLMSVIMLLVQTTVLRHCWHLLSLIQRYQRYNLLKVYSK